MEEHILIEVRRTVSQCIQDYSTVSLISTHLFTYTLGIGSNNKSAKIGLCGASTTHQYVLKVVLTLRAYSGLAIVHRVRLALGNYETG